MTTVLIIFTSTTVDSRVSWELLLTVNLHQSKIRHNRLVFKRICDVTYQRLHFKFGQFFTKKRKQCCHSVTALFLSNYPHQFYVAFQKRGPWMFLFCVSQRRSADEVFLLGVCDWPFICCHRQHEPERHTEVYCSDVRRSCDGRLPGSVNEVISLFFFTTVQKVTLSYREEGDLFPFLFFSEAFMFCSRVKELLTITDK